MTDQIAPLDDELFPTGYICSRYKVVPRSVNRWVNQQKFPPPDLIMNGRKFWRRQTLAAHEKACVRGAA
jgi:hypothetical protein